MIKLIVGLGNPGEKYEKTRHNAGFWLVQRWARATGAVFDPASSALGWRAATAENGGAGDEKTDPPPALLLPQTFMNASGEAVAEWARELGLAPENILIAHDEMDLPVGAAKLKRGGGAGGHNGLKSVSERLGSSDYWRLRLGIGHPRALFQSPGAVAAGIVLETPKVLDFVLGVPGDEERKRLDAGIERALAALPFMITGQTAKAVGQLNRKGA